MDPRRVLIFRSVVQAGSITAGAKALGWTQPAVTQHMLALEREAGTPLLVRRSSGVEPTEAGKVLLDQANAIASHLDAATQQIDDLANARSGTVRLAAYPSGLAVTVPRALAVLSETHPGVQTELIEAEPPEALELLKKGEVDLALVFNFHENDRDAFHRQRLGSDPMRLVTSTSHPAVDSITTLDDARWVAGCERCRGHLVEVCKEAGFEPNVRHVTDDYVVVQALVSMDLAVAMLPQTALDAFLNPGVSVHEFDELGGREISLVYHEGMERVPAVGGMIDAVCAVTGVEVTPSRARR